MTKHFYNLDVLRTILAFLVALGHFFIWNGTLGIIPKSFFIAVDFFFVLSGFVLTQKVVHSKFETFRYFLSDFFKRRFFRLYPLYLTLFILCLIIQLAEFGPDIDPIRYFVVSLFLLQCMGFKMGARHIFSDTTIGVAWSISVEIWIGLLFFGVMFLLRKKTRWLLIFCAFFALLASSLISLFSPNHLDVHLLRIAGVTFGSIRCLGGFALGCISFFIFKFFEASNLSDKFFFIGEIIATIGSIFIFHTSALYHFISPYLFATLIPFLAINRGAISKFLSLGIFSALYSVSYGIYLIHPFYIWIWRYFSIPFTIMSGAIYCSALLVTATITYRWLEKPFLKYSKMHRFSWAHKGMPSLARQGDKNK